MEKKNTLRISSKYTFNELTIMNNDAVEHLIDAQILLEKLESEAERISNKAYWSVTTRESSELGRDTLSDKIYLSEATRQLGEIINTLRKTAVAYHLRDIAKPE